jgi:hypothetical protein
VTDRPTFVLGVGCQKGGTTWLFDYLAHHPEVAMCPVKEMHVFDAAYRPDLYRLPPASPEIARMIGDPELYRRYFLDLTREAAVVGEITPSYSVLSSEHFKTVKALLAPDFRMRVIFLMRDPVERMWSRAKMQTRGNVNTETLQQRFRDNLDEPEVVARTHYDATIHALETAFEPDELFYGFYETLFRQETVSRICEFLGIAYLAPDFSRRPNASPRNVAPQPEALAAARKAYASVYDFCAERFGADFIKSIWPNA